MIIAVHYFLNILLLFVVFALHFLHKLNDVLSHQLRFFKGSEVSPSRHVGERTHICIP